MPVLSNDVVYSFASIGTFLFTGAHGGLFRSTKNGEDWTTVTTGLRNKVVTALFVDGTSLLAGTWGGVFRSTNNGGSWTPLSTGIRNTQILSFAISGAHLYAGTWGSGCFTRATVVAVGNLYWRTQQFFPLPSRIPNSMQRVGAS